MEALPHATAATAGWPYQPPNNPSTGGYAYSMYYPNPAAAAAPPTLPYAYLLNPTQQQTTTADSTAADPAAGAAAASGVNIAPPAMSSPSAGGGGSGLQAPTFQQFQHMQQMQAAAAAATSGQPQFTAPAAHVPPPPQQPLYQPYSSAAAGGGAAYPYPYSYSYVPAPVTAAAAAAGATARPPPLPAAAAWMNPYAAIAAATTVAPAPQPPLSARSVLDSIELTSGDTNAAASTAASPAVDLSEFSELMDVSKCTRPVSDWTEVNIYGANLSSSAASSSGSTSSSAQRALVSLLRSSMRVRSVTIHFSRLSSLLIAMPPAGALTSFLAALPPTVRSSTLVTLNLSGNALLNLDGIARAKLNALQTLNVASNRLNTLAVANGGAGAGSGSAALLSVLPALTKLNVSYNHLRSLTGLTPSRTAQQQSQPPPPLLSSLDIRGNALSSYPALQPLAALTSLADLQLHTPAPAPAAGAVAPIHSNPISSDAGYRTTIAALVPSLASLDGQAITNSKRTAAAENKRSAAAAAVPAVDGGDKGVDTGAGFNDIWPTSDDDEPPQRHHPLPAHARANPNRPPRQQSTASSARAASIDENGDERKSGDGAGDETDESGDTNTNTRRQQPALATAATGKKAATSTPRIDAMLNQFKQKQQTGDMLGVLGMELRMQAIEQKIASDAVLRSQQPPPPPLPVAPAPVPAAVAPTPAPAPVATAPVAAVNAPAPAVVSVAAPSTNAVAAAPAAGNPLELGIRGTRIPIGPDPAAAASVAPNVVVHAPGHGSEHERERRLASANRTEMNRMKDEIRKLKRFVVSQAAAAPAPAPAAPLPKPSQPRRTQPHQSAAAEKQPPQPPSQPQVTAPAVPAVINSGPAPAAAAAAPIVVPTATPAANGPAPVADSKHTTPAPPVAAAVTAIPAAPASASATATATGDVPHSGVGGDNPNGRLQLRVDLELDVDPRTGQAIANNVRSVQSVPPAPSTAATAVASNSTPAPVTATAPAVVPSQNPVSQPPVPATDDKRPRVADGGSGGEDERSDGDGEDDTNPPRRRDSHSRSQPNSHRDGNRSGEDEFSANDDDRDGDDRSSGGEGDGDADADADAADGDDRPSDDDRDTNERRRPASAPSQRRRSRDRHPPAQSASPPQRSPDGRRTRRGQRRGSNDQPPESIDSFTPRSDERYTPSPPPVPEDGGGRRAGSRSGSRSGRGADTSLATAVIIERLQRELAESKQSSASLQSKYDSEHRANAALQQKLDAVTAELHRAQAASTAFSSAHSQQAQEWSALAAARHTELQTRLNERERQVSTLTAANSELKRDVTRWKDRSREQQRANASASASHERALADVNAQLAAAQAASKQAGETVASLTAKHDEYRQLIGSLEQKIASELTRQRDKFAQLQTVCAEKIRDVADLKELLKVSLVKEKKLTAVNDKLSEIARAQRDKLAEATRHTDSRASEQQQQLSALESKLRDATAQLQTAQVSNGVLTAQLNAVRANEQKLNDTIADKQKRCDELRDECERLESSLDKQSNHSQLAAEHEQALAAAQTEVERIGSELEKARDAVAVKNRMLDDQNETIAGLKTERAQLQKECDELIDDSKSADAKLEELKSELSLCAEKLSVRDDRLSELRTTHSGELRALQTKHAEAMGFVDREVQAMRALWSTKERDANERTEQITRTCEEKIKTNELLLKSANEQLTLAQSNLNQKQQECAGLRDSVSTLAKELLTAKSSVQRTENEMRSLLTELEKKKQLAAQLAKALAS